MNPILCLCTRTLTLMALTNVDPKCINAWLMGRAQLKPWGIKKDSVPYMAEIVLTNIYIVYPYVYIF